EGRHLEARHTARSEAEHLDPVRGRRDRARALVRRTCGGDEEQAIEAELDDRLLGHDEMPDVDGIERAAEHAEALGAPQSVLRSIFLRRFDASRFVPDEAVPFSTERSVSAASASRPVFT